MAYRKDKGPIVTEEERPLAASAPSSKNKGGEAEVLISPPHPQGVWKDQDFFAGASGLDLRMSRRLTFVSDSEWEIVDNSGTTMLKCLSHANDTLRTRDFADAAGNSLFQLKKTGMRGHRVATTPSGEQLFTISRESIAVLNTPKFTVSFKNSLDGSAVEWTASGDFLRHNLEIIGNSTKVAHIERPEGMWEEAFKRGHVYTLKVAPRVDYTVLAALVVAFDDLRVNEGYM